MKCKSPTPRSAASRAVASRRVIADEENGDDLDSVLAWVVGRWFAWPARWGGLDVVPDADAAAARLGP